MKPEVLQKSPAFIRPNFIHEYKISDKSYNGTAYTLRIHLHIILDLMSYN